MAETHHLCFTLKERPAILSSAQEIPYHGSIKEEAVNCYASFPGKYSVGWDALVDEHHRQSVACVFLCTPDDGLGKHHTNPDGNGECYCHTIYGQRDFKTFGYLIELPSSCSEAEEKIAIESGKAKNAVVVRADATKEAKKQAEEKAKEAYEDSGRTASWGCEWFQKWKEQVAEAIKLKQRLKVVFFPGQCGRGIVPWEDLKNDHIDLWNGVGCGGSQKCEIAYLELMKQETGDGLWDYDAVDVTHFLKSEFKVGAMVCGLDGKQWSRGTLLRAPSTLPTRPEEAKWTVESMTGHIFATDRIMHGDSLQKMLAEVGHDKFLSLVRDSLPAAVKVLSDQNFVLPDGTLSLAITLQIKDIELLQYVRNEVLSNDLESNINKHLEQWQVQVDKTNFCKALERDLLNFSDLTDHQKEKLKDIENLMRYGDVHLRAPAGAGKTFVAAQCVLNMLRGHQEGSVLFLAPSVGLGLYFVRWLAQKCDGQLHLWLKRVVLMAHPYEHFLSLDVEGDRLRWTPMPDSKMHFILTVIDEAHDVVQHFAFEKLEPPRKVLLLSSTSQTSSHQVIFPPAAEITLTQVVRSTQRIVAGAAAFQVDEKQQIGSLCPAGPPLKAVLFESAELYQDYAKHAMSALFSLFRSYAGLSLHNRLAVLVPNSEFLEKFKDALKVHLKTSQSLRLAGRNFKLIDFETSLCILPHFTTEPTAEDDAELIIVDTVDRAKGLESLLVMCIGLDQTIGDQSDNLMTRSLIYQALTRAQLQVIVVNELVRGGWLEFLGLTKFKVDTFDESTALAETTTDAAEMWTKVSLAPTKDATPIHKVAEEVEEKAPCWEPRLPIIAKTGDVEIKDSSVWDADVIDIKEPIQTLQFDPRSPGKGSDEISPEVLMDFLMSIVHVCLYVHVIL